MKKNKLTFFLLGVLVLMFFIGFVGPVKALTEVNYDFEKDVLYESDSPIYDQNFNVVNKTRYTGEYNATFSFTDEVAIDTDIDYVDAVFGNVEIISDYFGHDDVLHCFSEDAGNMRHNFDLVQISGVIEFYDKEVLHRNYVQLISEDEIYGVMIIIYSASVRFYYGNGVGGSIYEQYIFTTEFPHFKIGFDCVTDKYSGWCEGNLIVDDVNFYNDLDMVNCSSFYSYNSQNFDFCLDAVDFSWTPGYFDGRNKLCLTEMDTLIQEVDRYEFALEGINDLNDLSLNNPNGWDYIGDGTDVNIVLDGGVDNGDRAVEFNAVGAENSGLENDFLYTGHNRLEVTFGFNISQWDVDDGDLDFKIYSYDSSLVMHAYVTRVAGAYKLYSFYNGGGGTTYIYPFINIDDCYDLSIYIDFYLNMSIVRLKENGVYVDQFAYEVSLYDVDLCDKEGISEVKCFIDGVAGNDIKLEIDYIGVYCDSEPKTIEFGYMEKRFDFDNWDVHKYNLFCIESRGYYALYKYWNVAGTLYEVEDITLDVIDELVYHYASEGENLYNIYDFTNESGYPSYLTYFKGFYELSSLSIEGVKMVEGNNSYPLEFFYGNVNINESYFRAGSDNRLNFNMVMDDNESEYISANFNINDFTCRNKSISFSSIIEGGGYSDLAIHYASSSNYLPIPNYLTSINVMMPQEKTCVRFLLIVYDNDAFESGSVNGYITGLKTIDYMDSIVTVATLGLLEIIIPVLILVVIPLAFSKRFGNKVIMPVFVLMSIICLVTNLIPIWVFFVLMFAVVGFIFIDKKSGGFSSIDLKRPKKILKKPKKKTPSVKDAKKIMKGAIKRRGK